MQKVAKYVFTLLIVLMLSYLALIFSAKEDDREYNVLAPQNVIKLGSKKLRISEIAEKYKPFMFVHKSFKTPNLLWVWYEPVMGDKKLIILYYFVWENEIHPNWLFDKIYALYRSVYYGTPLYDIEYVQVEILKESGVIGKFQFETSLSGYYDEKQKHLVLESIIQKNMRYSFSIEDKNGSIEQIKENFLPIFLKQHVLLKSISWNHLSGFLGQDEKKNYIEFKSPLIPLNNWDYVFHKFYRRSKGDYN